MRNFLIVTKFEFLNLVKNKTAIIATVIICLLLSLGLSAPTIRDTFFSSSDEEIAMDQDQGAEHPPSSGRTYGFINKGGITNVDDLKQRFFAGELVAFNNQEELEEQIRSGEVEAGYIIESPTQYQHIVQNNELMGTNPFAFESALAEAYRISAFEDMGIEYSSVEGIISVHIEQQDTVVLGTDSASNYMYTYILVFGLYFLIIIYGQIIATSVASEKSNRAMEVLITSTDSTHLIFGKVIAGALAGICQFGLVILTGITAYNLNAAAWDNSLDFVFKIPGSTLLSFSAFGILGYLFYLFIFGALGALVSRTEDVNTSSTPITLIFVAVFIVSMTGMQNTEGMVLKIASFVPFSSFMAMFVRVSMGTVSTLEVIASLSILAITTALIGYLASKIYRMGTLMYGNPVKLRTVLKLSKGKSLSR
ncbi:ABC transporter permease [Serpentinicella sp. ANB-PHB4]|uniref:ABC transporter permease n=1 Tax=Serpentinicella sp. ANB-PHB4 TaxID=3074076 RepID=UPI0028622296|nr:ABC transporter permease [Serpentinicella sp. ANB-PHB4]MDR5659631.1 ABC transporter permease [Serpentinicella sp. ANB-PHB4]